MEYTTLGRTGLQVSRISLGCMSYGEPGRGNQPWSLPEDESVPFFRQAIDGGINFFDTANVYSLGSSEEITGRALAKFAPREDLVIATKVHGVMRPGPGGGGLSRKSILTEIDHSLRRLGTDYVDLYQIHRWDDDTPIEETLATLDDLRRAGKIRYAGASNTTAWQLMQALWTSELHDLIRFDSLQPRYNIVFRSIEAETVPACIANGVGIIVYNPLAAGMLTAKYRGKQVAAPVEGTRFTLGNMGPLYRQRYWQQETLDVVTQLADDVASRGKSLTHGGNRRRDATRAAARFARRRRDRTRRKRPGGVRRGLVRTSAPPAVRRRLSRSYFTAAA